MKRELQAREYGLIEALIAIAIIGAVIAIGASLESIFKGAGN